MRDAISLKRFENQGFQLGNIKWLCQVVFSPGLLAEGFYIKIGAEEYYRDMFGALSFLDYPGCSYTAGLRYTVIHKDNMCPCIDDLLGNIITIICCNNPEAFGL